MISVATKMEDFRASFTEGELLKNAILHKAIEALYINLLETKPRAAKLFEFMMSKREDDSANAVLQVLDTMIQYGHFEV